MRARLREAVRNAPPWAIVLAGWLVAVVFAYPGILTDESLGYLRGARERYFSDAHSFGVTWLWRRLEWVIAGPSGWLLLQTGALATGGYRYLASVGTARVAAWLTVALLVAPPTLAAFAVIDTHVMAAGGLALGAALVSHPDRAPRFAGLATLWLVTLVLPSAAIATLPLVVLLWPERTRRRDGIVAWLAITALALGFNVALARQPSSVWHSRLAAIDIAALAEAPPALPADGAAPPLAVRTQLAEHARQLAVASPLAYLSHRVAVFGEVLHPQRTMPPRPTTPELLRHGVSIRSSELQDVLDVLVGVVATLFPPWLFVLGSIALFVVARRDRTVVALVVSGLALELSLLVTIATPRYADSGWLIVATLLAASRVYLTRRTR